MQLKSYKPFSPYNCIIPRVLRVGEILNEYPPALYEFFRRAELLKVFIIANSDEHMNPIEFMSSFQEYLDKHPEEYPTEDLYQFSQLLKSI